MVINATFNNISVTSWRSVLLEEETRVPGENHQPTTRFHRIVGLIFLFYRIQVTCSVEFVILALPVLKQETERLKKMVGE
jgi:hypothetical protein